MGSGIDPTELERAAELCEKAVPAPWSVVQNPNGVAIYGPEGGIEDGYSEKLMHLGHDYDYYKPWGLRDTAEFIAFARDFLPRLLEDYHRQQDESETERVEWNALHRRCLDGVIAERDQARALQAAELDESTDQLTRLGIAEAECVRLREALRALFVDVRDHVDGVDHEPHADGYCCGCAATWPCPFDAARVLVEGTETGSAGDD